MAGVLLPASGELEFDSRPPLRARDRIRCACEEACWVTSVVGLCGSRTDGDVATSSLPASFIRSESGAARPRFRLLEEVAIMQIDPLRSLPRWSGRWGPG